MCGIEEPTSGNVFINGEELERTIDFPKKTSIMINEPGFVGMAGGFSNLKQLVGIRDAISEEQIHTSQHDLDELYDKLYIIDNKSLVQLDEN